MVLRTALAWIESGIPATLVTVVRTWGASPRPPGSLMAISGDGRIAGSVSGGCVEEDLLGRLAASPLHAPCVVTYGASATDRDRLRIPCGAAIELVMEPVRDPAPLRSIIETLDAGGHITRILDLPTGTIRLRSGATSTAVHFDGEMLEHRFGPDWRLILIGANDVARYSCQFAQPLGFAVTVCDPREEFAASWDLPGVTLRRDMPDDLIQTLNIDPHCAIVALAHDPRLDDMGLMEALKSPAFYVGAIGSRATSAQRKARLLQLDLTPEHVARLHGPVGLDIGSRTPPEIAIAILAELIAERRKLT
ncbi:MAG: XdhC family protein [Pseudomonadota bacterium]